MHGTVPQSQGLAQQITQEIRKSESQKIMKLVKLLNLPGEKEFSFFEAK